ncbi:MAG: 4Fe-4S binding protein [Oscillospiraceae bacterium]|jgi:iron only hydrogenase large subunit-like protein/uncharacterized Fe-S cluster-containing protein|nr:4Fe-4S binding protein [Oscillospiraceae bacterium]
MKQSTVYTLTANCQDCYRCVRVCPVNAIRVSGGQAQVQDELCIKCGTCVRECPQHAKTIISSLDDAKQIISSGVITVASVAPSFVAVFGKELASRFPSALRRLGFHHVCETAEGAKYVTDKSFMPETAGSICTACPAVVNYVEQYKPELIPELIPVVSPMIAHGRLLKEYYPGCAVVFIGPCAAKKQEARRPEYQGIIDAVLTFTELQEWFDEEDIHLENCIESGFENKKDLGDARLFPIQGGMLKTGNIAGDIADTDVLHVSGIDDVMTLFDTDKNRWNYRYVELLFCKGGCIDGPAVCDGKNMLVRRKDIIDYAEKMNALPKTDDPTEVDYDAKFDKDEQARPEVSEAQINIVLERTGKSDPVWELNCGACGYKTCRENAEAVVRGMAEPEMCVSYMRRLAQQRTDRIIETTPNGIVILDQELRILEMNPAFQKMFLCNNGILGRHISYLVNAEGYEKLMTENIDKYESIQSKYGIRYHEILYPLREEEQYIGIYSDISKVKFDNKQLDVVTAQTLKHAREFLNHQITFAQEMAHFLGKSTAKSEELARSIINLYESPQDADEKKGVK